MVPAHLTEILKKGNYYCIDGAHTINSLNFILRKYTESITKLGRRNRKNIIIMS